jgi:DNA-binding response OmpR family regulator
VTKNLNEKDESLPPELSMFAGKIWILIVEDDITSRMMLANQLHKKGFEVICAEDGEQAVEIIKYCVPDCILLDLIMPRMHGHAFLTLLRENDRTLPVIIMSTIEDQPGVMKIS